MEKRGAGVVAAVSNFCALTTSPGGASCGNAGLGYKNCSRRGVRRGAVARGAGLVRAAQGLVAHGAGVGGTRRGGWWHTARG
ncbi:hypothetical protein FRC0326_02040 [Corynebacterium diphtheriae]|nr:hypothetical protein FRC0326_02040 [Corynebacterium diphtheriae]